MSELADIIARLEKATGPDEAIDAEVWCVVYAPDVVAIDHGAKFPPYTTSIDAALTLVPNQPWIGPWSILSRGNSWEAEIGAGFHPRDVGYESRAKSNATPAIALCIAALKARQQ